MKQVILVCGNWIFDNNKWLFVVDNERGSRILQCNDQSRFDDCIGMVYEDYRLDNKVFDVVLSYKISKRLLQDLPGDTPPVIIDNSRQLHTFLGQLERDTGRLCVEVKKKIQTDLNHIGKKRGRDENDQVGEEYLDMASDTNEEEMDEDDSRFDYCDDSDGTDSDDENFTLYGIPPEEEDHKLPMKKRSSSFYIEENKEPVDVSKVDLSSVNLAVGQMYDTKEHLKTRLKILTLVQRFDYYVYKSRPTLLIVKCWVKGCKWRVTAATLRHFPKFEVRVFISAHTCSVTERSMRARQADHHILGELYKDFVGGVGPKVLPMHVAEALNKRFHIKGKYLGTLLTATAQDGNFQIFPIAFAVVDTENDESWEWFFKQLSCVILDDESLSIIYDRHQSIGKAIKKVYPKSSRGICTYHMYKNILVRFKGRAEFALVKKAANAFRLIDFQTTFDQIEAMNPALHEYLVRADVRMWTRVHFPGDRYNLLTSNIAESMNKVMSHARSFPIVQLLEEIRSMMTRWFSDRRTDALKMTTNLTRGVEKIFQVCSFLSFLSKCVCYTTKFLI
ncbi:PREDICTED: uncharacterized protein LOC109124917 isoform X3 [Camelina sativa]|uniref:Uncharacterized protein LOC109124917 isoform X3 n=1 Tax=Camelina sativa TaxID=90675 RepID=A0ABM1RQS3_CAMSA|nr:PREDICTED: uncharacterized protein LOC109124917 isoform X3 [Camelina sativa]